MCLSKLYPFLSLPLGKPENHTETVSPRGTSEKRGKELLPAPSILTLGINLCVQVTAMCVSPPHLPRFPGEWELLVEAGAPAPPHTPLPPPPAGHGSTCLLGSLFP